MDNARSLKRTRRAGGEFNPQQLRLIHMLADPQQAQAMGVLNLPPVPLAPNQGAANGGPPVRPNQQVPQVFRIAKPTVVAKRFLDSTQQVQARLAPTALNALAGRGATLVSLEKDLKGSTRFATMMSKLGEVEALGAVGKSTHVLSTSKLDELRAAAVIVRDHYAAEYSKEVASKPESAQAKGHAAAQKLIDEIEVAKSERMAAIVEAKNLMADLRGQVDRRNQGGQGPVDAGAISALEALLQDPNRPAEFDLTLATLLRDARQALGNRTDAQREQDIAAKAEVCLKLGTAKAPDVEDSGASDSFFLKDASGKPAFVFKPMEGEADQSERGWEKGGAAPRELLASALNDQLTALGLGCGVPQATLVQLQAEVFKGGKNSQEGVRTGALLQFTPNDKNLTKLIGTPPGDVRAENKDQYCDDPVELARRKQLINQKDLHDIALFDLISLNLDRSAANLLTRHEGANANETIRLLPIDSGNLLPCRVALDTGIDGMGVDFKDADAALGDSNALMQLPQSQVPFDDDTAGKIDALVPDTIVSGMEAAYNKIATSAPAMQGKVTTPEVFDMMKISMKILKRACGTLAQPRLSPAEMNQMYWHDLKPLLDLALGPAGQPAIQPMSDVALLQEIDQMIQRQVARSAAALRRPQVLAQIQILGGEDLIQKLGWKNVADLVRDDADRALLILQNLEVEPELLNNFQRAGGDVKMPDWGLNPGDYAHITEKWSAMLPFVQGEEYDDLGGDDAVRQLYQQMSPAIEIYRQNYTEWSSARDTEAGSKQSDRAAWTKTHPMPQGNGLWPALRTSSLDELLAPAVTERLETLNRMRTYLNVV